MSKSVYYLKGLLKNLKIKLKNKALNQLSQITKRRLSARIGQNYHLAANTLL